MSSVLQPITPKNPNVLPPRRSTPTTNSTSKSITKPTFISSTPTNTSDLSSESEDEITFAPSLQTTAACENTPPSSSSSNIPSSSSQSSQPSSAPSSSLRAKAWSLRKQMNPSTSASTASVKVNLQVDTSRASLESDGGSSCSEMLLTQHSVYSKKNSFPDDVEEDEVVIDNTSNNNTNNDEQTGETNNTPQSQSQSNDLDSSVDDSQFLPPDYDPSTPIDVSKMLGKEEYEQLELRSNIDEDFSDEEEEEEECDNDNNENENENDGYEKNENNESGIMISSMSPCVEAHESPLSLSPPPQTKPANSDNDQETFFSPRQNANTPPVQKRSTISTVNKSVNDTSERVIKGVKLDLTDELDDGDCDHDDDSNDNDNETNKKSTMFTPTSYDMSNLTDSCYDVDVDVNCTTKKNNNNRRWSESSYKNDNNSKFVESTPPDNNSNKNKINNNNNSSKIQGLANSYTPTNHLPKYSEVEMNVKLEAYAKNMHKVYDLKLAEFKSSDKDGAKNSDNDNEEYEAIILELDSSHKKKYDAIMNENIVLAKMLGDEVDKSATLEVKIEECNQICESKISELTVANEEGLGKMNELSKKSDEKDIVISAVMSQVQERNLEISGKKLEIATLNELTSTLQTTNDAQVVTINSQLTELAKLTQTLNEQEEANKLVTSTAVEKMQSKMRETATEQFAVANKHYHQLKTNLDNLTLTHSSLQVEKSNLLAEIVKMKKTSEIESDNSRGREALLKVNVASVEAKHSQDIIAHRSMVTSLEEKMLVLQSSVDKHEGEVRGVKEGYESELGKAKEDMKELEAVCEDLMREIEGK